MAKQSSKSLVPSFTAVFKYSDGTTESVGSSTLLFKGIQKHGIGRPSSVVVTCNNKEMKYLVDPSILERIRQLKTTLLRQDTKHVTLKPDWFNALIAPSKIIILTGHSGAGKDAVSAALCQASNITAIVPHATRDMRENEVEGNPYYFISNERFLEMVDNEEFIEHAVYTTQFNGKEAQAYYGTAEASIPSNMTSVITIGVNAAKVLKERLGDRAKLVYLHVSDTIREERAIQRGSFDKIEWDNRLTQDHKRFGGEIPTGMDVVIDNMQPLALSVADVLNNI